MPLKKINVGVNVVIQNQVPRWCSSSQSSDDSFVTEARTVRSIFTPGQLHDFRGEMRMIAFAGKQKAYWQM